MTNCSRLQSLMIQDQQDRDALVHRVITEEELQRRDQVRYQEVRQLTDSKQTLSTEECYSLAMILHHVGDADDCRKAHHLSLQAYRGGQKQARYLVAASLDRSLLLSGLPQRYGTQIQYINQQWQLYDLDPTTEDYERTKWNVPSLEHIMLAVKQMNTSDQKW